TPDATKTINGKSDCGKPQSQDIFLEYVVPDEAQFNEFVDRTVIPPNKPNYQTNKITSKTWDFDQWYREDNKKK
ncbi:MAG: hypothetical protein H8E55_52910, partial [Pelagibacterales bacterium]|nr:hypothetical protein [Pelagibacterales bacterium]